MQAPPARPREGEEEEQEEKGFGDVVVTVAELAPDRRGGNESVAGDGEDRPPAGEDAPGEVEEGDDVERPEEGRERRQHPCDLVLRGVGSVGETGRATREQVEGGRPDVDAALRVVQPRVADRNARKPPRDGGRPAEVGIRVRRGEAEPARRGRGEREKADGQGEEKGAAEPEQLRACRPERPHLPSLTLHAR